ncbi:MAG: hypothetical protein WAN36_16865 [Calditrichia bacterium]
MKKEKTSVLAVAFGVATGVIIGILTKNLGVWISLGTAMGVVIGILLDKKQKNLNKNKT